MVGRDREEPADVFEESRRVQTDTNRSIFYHNEVYQIKHMYGESKKINRIQDVVTAPDPVSALASVEMLII